MLILNVTPHTVTLFRKKKKPLVFPRAGAPVRVSSRIERVGHLNGIPLTKLVYDKPEGLPEEQDNVFYIVSTVVKAALPDRRDLLVPAEMVRDSDGKKIGCQSFDRERR